MEMKKISLLTGILIVPENCVVIKETYTETADFAGILADREGRQLWRVICSDKPITDFTEAEEEKAYSLCMDAVEQLELGLFAIPEVEDEGHLYLGTGIIREGV